MKVGDPSFQFRYDHPFNKKEHRSMTATSVCNVVKRSVATVVFLLLATPGVLFAETVGVFYDAKIPQIKFAADDVKAALESKKFTVEMLNLAQLASPPYAHKKVVVALASNTAVTGVLTAEGGTRPTGLGEQAYALRTTKQGQVSYWALGGDVNGAMYGGLQIAENINFDSYGAVYNSQESPAILKRGMKLNLPLDERSPTYAGSSKGASYKKAIPDVWDMTFWVSWFDEMARHRYNVVSIWNDHPFTSLIKLADYPNAALQDLKGYDGFSRTMSTDEKIVFWKQIMAYAHSRGFEFMLVNWNIYTDGATGKYGIDENHANPATVTYMRKSMTKLLETYPDLDGFGVTAGEHMGSATDPQKEQWLWNTYGQGMYDYAIANPKRKLTFIHRFHQTALSEVKKYFASLIKLPNVAFDMSFKYSSAHMYSTPVPKWMGASDIKGLVDNNLKTWFTVRNDDIYYLHWGDPNFARAYLNGFPGKGTYFKGFYMGSDGSAPTRTFFSKNSVTQGGLEVQRHWYLYMLWGRLSYNPATSDSVFKNYMKLKYPGVPSDDLFTAWSKASSSIPKITELVQKTLKLDFHWWPEACLSHKGFITAAAFSNAGVGAGSALCSIADSSSNSCGGNKSSYQLADEIEADAVSALSIANRMSPAPNTELRVNIDNIKAMAYFSTYFAYKIRGATYLKAGEAANAKTALGTAYCNWMTYTNLMDAMYTGQTMQRVNDLPSWHSMDAEALKDFTSNGGSGAPACASMAGSAATAEKKGKAFVQSLSGTQVTFFLPAGGKYSLSMFAGSGERVAGMTDAQGKKGVNVVKLGKKLAQGVYVVHLDSQDASTVGSIEVKK